MLAASSSRPSPVSIPLIALALMLLGVTGIERGDELSRAGVFHDKQMVWIALSIPVFLFVARVPYRSLRHHAWWLFAIALIGLVVVFVFPPRWGSRRWIPLPGMFFQPSEMAKLAFIVALARYLMHRDHHRSWPGLLPPFLLCLLPMGLILKEPDLGTSLLFVPVLFAMLFVAGARLRHLAFVVLLAVVASPVFWTGMSAEQKSRITAVFQQRDGGPTPRGDGYHLHQSKQVLALGGVSGSEWGGTTSDDPMAYYLPACRTDFVLCMIGERWGVAGTLGCLGLYLWLFAAGLRVAGATRDPFGRLVATGIVTLLAAQTIINAGMTVGLMPITGITLPLVSYGGSSLLFSAVAIGLLVNIGSTRENELAAEPFRFARKSARANWQRA
jgi:cell division protein FtsW (lipid II flippase)